MHIVIPTYGRSGKQTTWNQLPASVRKRTVLVVQDRERHLYPNFPTAVLPPSITTIGPTRQWILEQFTPHQCVLDDDLTFAVRRQDNRGLFRPAEDSDIEDMFANIQEMICGGFVHVGIGSREGGNRVTEELVYNTRQLRVLAYNADVLNSLGVRFDRLPCKVDFDVTLQLLRKGYANVLLNDWVSNQSGSNTVGGCSHFRTKEVLDAAAHELARLHAPHVTIVTKTTKGAWGGGERTDVRIAWKNAYAEGQARLLDSGAGEDPA